MHLELLIGCVSGVLMAPAKRALACNSFAGHGVSKGEEASLVSVRQMMAHN